VIYSLSLWLPLGVLEAPVAPCAVPGVALGSKSGTSVFGSKRFASTKRSHVLKASASPTRSPYFLEGTRVRGFET